MKHIYIAISAIGILGALGILFLATSGLPSGTSPSEERGQLHALLGNYLLPDVTIDDVIYHVEDGVVSGNDGVEVSEMREREVLRLAWFSTITRENPLFALQGVDTARLGRSVDLLESSVSSLLPEYSEPEQKQLVALLYPVSFLHILSELEKGRRTVVRNPTDETVGEYVHALEKAISEYGSYIDNLIVVHSAFANESDQTVNTTGGSFSHSQFVRFLEDVRRVNAENKARLEIRNTCLRTFTDVCEVPGSSDVPPASGSISVPHGTGLEESLQKIFEIYEERFSGTSGFWRPEQTAVISLGHDACLPGLADTHYYIWWHEHETDHYAIRAEHLNNIFFYDVRKRNETNPTPYFETVENAGIQYLSQRLSNLYMCPDQTLNLATVSTALYIQWYLTADPLFIELQSSGAADLSNLQTLEAVIVESIVLSDEHIEAYLSLITSLLAQTSERELAELIGESTVLRMKELLAIWKQKSPLFDQLLLGLIDSNAGLRDIFSTGNTIPLDSLFLTRSYPMATLLIHNGSVTGDAHLTSLSQLETPLEEYVRELNLIPYIGALDAEYSSSEIIDIMKQKDAIFQ